MLMAMGTYRYLGYGWHGCVQTPPPSNVSFTEMKILQSKMMNLLLNNDGFCVE